MKSILYTITIFTFLLGLGTTANAQCNPGEYADACIQKLQGGFNFVKSYKIDGQGGNKKKVEYSYVFAKGTQYMLNICSGQENTDGIVITLFDSNRKIVSTNKANGKIYSAIAYPCNATGIYYMSYTFDQSQSFCGGAALGFKR